MTRSPLARLALAAAAVGGLVGAALVATQAPPTGAAMTAAADKFLAALSAGQKQKAALPFDDPGREKWYFTPQQENKVPTRKGVRLDELSADQKGLALDLLRAGLSAKGYDQATTIMSLEGILHDLEKNGANVRNPDWYFVTVFGAPSNTGRWAWRVEGHHLSVNVTLDRGEVVSATPVVFGANPAEVRQGPRKGLRTLPEVEDLAKQLIASLTDDQRATARQPRAFAEIKEGQPAAGVGAPVGLPAARMTEPQRAALLKLLEAYAGRLPGDVAAAELRKVKDAGIEHVHFGYHVDEAKPGKPGTYRVQGPTFVVEFLNVQADGAGNPANHIHSGWRALPADFGRAAADPPKGPAAGSPVKLVHVATGKVLGVANDSPEAGALAVLAADDGAAAKRWRAEPDGRHLRLVNHGTRLLLDVSEESKDEGAEVVQWDPIPGGSDNQRWEWVGAGPGRRLRSKSSGLVLDVAGDRVTQKKAADGAQTQLWRVDP